METVVKRFDSSNSDVFKYVFEFKNAVAEAVLYKYGSFKERTVLCVSVQSGCPVGCTFCGTGKKFIRNLTYNEIIHQVEYCLEDMEISCKMDDCNKFQIMFMSMGEPMLNYEQTASAIAILNKKFPNAELLISTMGPKRPVEFNYLLNLSGFIDKIGLQFSIHEAFDGKRNILIPYKNKLTLREIRDYGVEWNKATGREVYLNYCIGEDNQSIVEMNRLMDLFPPNVFCFTFSVICSANETMKDAGYRNLDKINKIYELFLDNGYNVRVFDPAGQDDIGGGCGQLWYVQDWMNKHNE